MGVGGQVMKSGETRREKNQNLRRATLPVPRYVVGLWLSHRPVLQGWALPGRVCSWWWTKMLCSKAKMREIRICTKKCGGREDLWKWDDNKFPMVGTMVCNWNVMSFPPWLLMDVYVWRKQDSFLLHPLSLFPAFPLFGWPFHPTWKQVNTLRRSYWEDGAPGTVL